MASSNIMTSLAITVSTLVLPSVAIAQNAPEEIVVIGNYGKAPDSVRTLSQAVSYADLDLSTKSGQDEMQHRVKLTARFLCDKLGESRTGDPLVPSCQDAATRDAMKRVGTVEATSAPRGTTWVHPPTWTAPYPPDWSSRYP